MKKKINFFYKNRKWNDFHFTFGSVLKDIKIVQPSVFHEFRGSITTTYHSDYYDKLIPDSEFKKGVKFKHDRFSKSKKGVLRGLHWDKKTWKLVSCPHGKIYLVVVDLNPKSINYKKWESFIISPETSCQILIPPFFANGHYVLEDDSIFHYKMAYSGIYNDESKQQTELWNDKEFDIDWPSINPILSKRDRLL